MLTLRQLELLVGIADFHSISHCALSFGLTQPAVTHQIQLLEEELHCPLVQRRTRGVTLTAQGQIAVSHARTVLQEAQKIVAQANHFKSSLTGRITLGVSPLSMVTLRHFPVIYRTFHNMYSEVQIQLRELDGLHIIDQLKNRQVDLAITPLPLFSLKAHAEELWREELVVISSPEQHLEPVITFEELRHREFILMTSGYSVNLTIVRLARQAGFEPRVRAEAHTLYSLLGFVASGLGIAVVPMNSVVLECEAGLLALSRLIPTTYRQIVMAYDYLQDIPLAVQEFMTHIRAYARGVNSSMESLLTGPTITPYD